MNDKKLFNQGKENNARGHASKQTVPVNVERVLLDAAENKSFFKELMEDPGSALEKHGYVLTQSESQMILAMPRQTLEETIVRLTHDVVKRSRVALKIAAGAAAVSVLVVPAFFTFGHTAEIREARENAVREAEESIKEKADAGVEEEIARPPK